MLRLMGWPLDMQEEQMKWQERNLRHAEFLQIAFDRLESIFCFDSDGNAVYANEAACRLLGYTCEELLSCRMTGLAPDFSNSSWREYWQKVRFSESFPFETEFLSKSERKIPVEVTSTHFANGGSEFICAIVRDISERRQKEESMRLAEIIYKSSNEAVMLVDGRNRIVHINPAFTRITDYNFSDLYGKNPDVLRSNLHEDDFYQDMQKDIGDIGYWQGEIWGRRRGSELFASHVTISLIRNDDGSVFGHVWQFIEITEKKRRDEQILQHANYDELTALPNRRLFHDRLALEIKKSNRTGHPVALLFIDLDGFKQINDNFGHDKGDLMLIEAAHRIEKCVRETDTVARLGGDEFTIILPNYGSSVDVERVVLSVIQELGQPFQLKDQIGLVSASIGIAIYPDDAQEVAELLKCADQAMYETKRKGRKQFSYVAEQKLHDKARNSYFKRRSMYFQQLSK